MRTSKLSGVNAFLAVFVELMNDGRRMNEDETRPTLADDVISLLPSEELQYSSNSHDSFLQSDPHMDTVTSSTDDSSKVNQFFSPNFCSKDSALDLSDDQLHRLAASEPDDDVAERLATSSVVQDKSKLTRGLVQGVSSRSKVVCAKKKEGGGKKITTDTLSHACGSQLNYP